MIETCKLENINNIFLSDQVLLPHKSNSPLDRWNMERDDGPIFQYIYSTFKPRRHLEFGTWMGWGTALCLESSDATVWTINLPDGEYKQDGSWAYSERVSNIDKNSMGGIEVAVFSDDGKESNVHHRTDAGMYIGKIYREKNLGCRVNQIYCDSRNWDSSQYPKDFFDSVLIDGGHQPEVVISDTLKALSVLKPGGLIMWHDFCPKTNIYNKFSSVKGVTDGILEMLPALEKSVDALTWIDPSWILVGFKKESD